MSKNKIGVIGSGMVAQTLANGFLKHGYSVMLGSRDLTKLQDWKSQAGENGSLGSFSQAAEYGDIVTLAVKGGYAESVLELAGSDNLKNKTVIDVTNPIAHEPPVNGVLKFFTDLNQSLMEKLQVQVPSANFVKAFSCVGANGMVNPQFEEGKPTMFICGNSTDAKMEVQHILDQFGWDIEDLGMATAARAIEPLCMLWCIPGFLNNTWSHAFKLLRK